MEISGNTGGFRQATTIVRTGSIGRVNNLHIKWRAGDTVEVFVIDEFSKNSGKFGSKSVGKVQTESGNTLERGLCFSTVASVIEISKIAVDQLVIVGNGQGPQADWCVVWLNAVHFADGRELTVVAKEGDRSTAGKGYHATGQRGVASFIQKHMGNGYGFVGGFIRVQNPDCGINGCGIDKGILPLELLGGKPYIIKLNFDFILFGF